MPGAHAYVLYYGGHLPSKTTQANDKRRFADWIKEYLRFDLSPSAMTSLQSASRKAGFELDAYLVPAAYRSFGETYVYNLAALRQSMSSTATQEELLVRQESYHPLAKLGGKKEKESPEAVLMQAVVRVNQVWSLADAQSMLLRGWSRFMVMWAIPKHAPKSSRPRSASGSLSSPPSTPSTPPGNGSFDLTGHPGGAPDTPQAAHVSPLAGNASKLENPFLGDMRSFIVAQELSKSLVTTLPQADQDLKTGIVVAEVATELAEVLAAMLHHQLFDHEQLVKTADPRFSE